MRLRGPATLSLALVELVLAGCSTSSSTSGGLAADAGDDSAMAPKPAPLPVPDAGAPTGPALLSEAGLYSDVASRTLSSDLIAFTPRFELWADGAKKTRWLYLPRDAQIDTSAMDNWIFPVGTKVFKEFAYDGKVLETRLLMKVRPGSGNGSWWEAAYVWKEDGSDAVAMPAGVTRALGTSHDVPTQIDCKNCHGDVSDVLIGVSAIQLSDPILNPLQALALAGKLSTTPPTDIDVPGTGNVRDALAYLHANCGHCHNAQATRLASQSALRLRLSVIDKTPELTDAYTTTVGVVMRHPMPNDVLDVVVKGVPEKSGLWVRMILRDEFAMPPAGTQQIDPVGSETVRRWIADWK